MTMKLVRHPRSKKRVHPLVLHEISKTYPTHGEGMKSKLLVEVSNWDRKPTIEVRVKVTRKRWSLILFMDARRKENKIYNWVKEGTGERGNNPTSSYLITAVNAPALRYDLPSIPKTLPVGGQIPPTMLAEPGTVITKQVEHPGIYPRDFGKKLFKKQKSRTTGSFHNVTEAAIKRGLRKKIGGGTYIV